MNQVYLMITHWENHWDKIKKTKYSISMLKEGVDINKLTEGAETLFIKLNGETKLPEKAWRGTVSDYRIINDEIEFRVNIKEEVDIKQIPEDYKRKKPGWYSLKKNEATINDCSLIPPLIYLIQLTENWNEFEYYAFLLLKLIGINNLYRFASYKQKGTADGFFKIGNLAAIYDVTLDKKFEESKYTQINNYINQLNVINFKIPELNIEIPIANCNKEVWIITKNKTRLIKSSGEINIKEISIRALINIYIERLKNELPEKDLEERLIRLAKQ